jgi:hypothetical protein
MTTLMKMKMITTLQMMKKIGIIRTIMEMFQSMRMAVRVLSTIDEDGRIKENRVVGIC